jgi:glyoxylate reductase
MKIYVTRELPGSEFQKLKAEHEVIVNPSPLPPSGSELLNEVKGKDGLICLLTDPITREVIEAGSSLKVIANYAVGYDNIDVEYATERGIMVTNTPGALTNATAELAWALILSTARRTPEADRYTRDGKFKGWSPTLMVGTELYGKTLGIIGAGKIGTRVGVIAKGFAMSVLYVDMAQNDTLETLGAKKTELDELLAKSDFVSLHTPFTPETNKMIGDREFGLMKRDAFLINTSRGKVIDESALIQALAQKRIAGAGLDVYENEPDFPDELGKLDNVVLLPHIGSATKTAREKMAELAVRNLLIGLSGGEPPNLVNREAQRN